MPPSLSGVLPVLPTPFAEDGSADEPALRGLVRYAIRCGVDGLTYPGVASEVAQLTVDERRRLAGAVLDETAGRVPVVAGASSEDPDLTVQLGAEAAARGAAALMIAAPADRRETREQIEFFSRIAERVSVPIMLQNVPPPAGAGLEPQALIEVLRSVPAIRYVKEETLPSGQRLTRVRERAPATLAGVFGGAGGRYITDELRRGAAGTMPALELAEAHVALFAAHRAGDADGVRRLFTRMLPVLNTQAVFRWALTKYVLQRRGLIGCARQRAPGPQLDALDRADVDAFLTDLADLLVPERFA